MILRDLSGVIPSPQAEMLRVEALAALARGLVLPVDIIVSDSE